MIRNTEFKGIKYIALSELAPSQLYISAEKLRRVKEWFSPEALAAEPLPVRDFGNGRCTLTDGHTRAICAYMAGMTHIPAIYDRDDIVACPEGEMLYRMDIEWCARFNIRTIADLENRIVTAESYKLLWQARCDAGHALITHTTPAQRAAAAAIHPGLFLYGISADLKTMYFEDSAGRQYEFPEAIS